MRPAAGDHPVGWKSEENAMHSVGPARAKCAYFVAVLATIFASFVIGCESEPPKPGQAEFDAANGQIASFSSEVGFGNTPAAADLAKKFAKKVKALEAENFEGSKDAEVDPITKGNFLTYCQMSGPNIVFLVQTPNLDTYEGDVRKGLFEIAWEAAQEVTGKPANKTLVIALRGKLLYGVIGKGSADASAPSPQMGTALDTAALYSWFAAAAAPTGGSAAAPAASAK
jgi:hypothetical protein